MSEYVAVYFPAMCLANMCTIMIQKVGRYLREVVILVQWRCPGGRLAWRKLLPTVEMTYFYTLHLTLSKVRVRVVQGVSETYGGSSHWSPKRVFLGFF